MQKLQEQQWNGNKVQLESFCERLFLSVSRRTIQAQHVQYLWDELYPVTEVSKDQQKVVVYKHPEALKISGLLEKYRGNRVKVAEDMGISTTTLWRHMKKYGIMDKEI